MEWLIALAMLLAFAAGLLLGRRARPDALRDVVLAECLVVGPDGTSVDYQGGEAPYVVTPVGGPPAFHRSVEDALADFRRVSRV